MTEPIDQNKVIEKVNQEYSAKEILKEGAGENVLPESENRGEATRNPSCLRSEEEDTGLKN